jgi:hypothetical protein
MRKISNTIGYHYKWHLSGGVIRHNKIEDAMNGMNGMYYENGVSSFIGIFLIRNITKK